MPAAMNGDSSAHSTSPELGGGPGGASGAGPQAETLKQVLTVIDKKVRNMEKKKSKLEDYNSKKNRGESLNADQLEALSKAEEVTHNLDFARELQKSFMALGIDIQKAERKAWRREQLRREEVERRRVQRLLEVQLLLEQLGEEHVQQHLLNQDLPNQDLPNQHLPNQHLPNQDLPNQDLPNQHLPNQDLPNQHLPNQHLPNQDLPNQDLPNQHLPNQHLPNQDLPNQDLPNQEQPPLLTAPQLHTLHSFYTLVNPPHRDQSTRLAEQFEEASVHMWELLEGKDKPVVGTTYKALKETVDRVLQSGYFQSVHTHQNGVCEEEEPCSAVAAPSESSEPEEQPEPAVAEEAAERDYTETLVDTKEFVNRAQIAESSQSNTQEETTSEWNQEPEVSLDRQQPPLSETPPTSAEPAPPVSVATDPVVRKQVVQDLMAQMQGTYNFMQDSVLEFDGQVIDPAIVSVQSMSPAHSLERAQIGCSTVQSESQLLSQASAVPTHPEASLSCEQPPPKALHTGGVNVNATPFQSMTTAFSVNTPPMPPANDVDAQNLSSQYQSSFSPSYSSQPAPSEEQTDMQPVGGSFHSQDALQAGGAHQSLSQQAVGQGAGFSRVGAGQPFFVANRGGVMSRGAPRAARGSTNGYRGGYDGYRPPFPSAVGGNYGHTQFGNNPRDYTSYPRDVYHQQGFKRGAGQSSRGSRGRGGSFRCSRVMPTHQSG